MGTAAFNFGGGTLLASGSFTTTLPMTLTGTGGNATVDTAGYAVTFSGQLSGTGGLNKTDSGTLTLTGSNNYAGQTVLSGGTLELALSAQSSDPQRRRGEHPERARSCSTIRLPAMTRRARSTRCWPRATTAVLGTRVSSSRPHKVRPSGLAGPMTARRQ